jgi:hypothetical protein
MIEMIFEYFAANGDQEFLVRRLKNAIVSKIQSNTFIDKVNTNSISA